MALVEGTILLSIRNRRKSRTLQPGQVLDLELATDDEVQRRDSANALPGRGTERNPEGNRVADSLDSGGLRGAGQGGRTRGF